MRIPTGTLVAACALSAALLVAGCGGDGDRDTKASGELFLQPVVDQGPDPFTDSTATSTAAPPPITRTPQPGRSGPTAVRPVSGGTPGLYGGAERVGSCDVDLQIDHLTADRAKARAFAQVEGISQAAIPAYLRGLAPVALRADTRVTNHGYSAGRVTSYQSVLQAGTAVLVDNRGVPRVRCACGNPLQPPVATHASAGAGGRPWAGYRPDRVIVVAPTTRVITDITIIGVANNTWIERRIGHDVRHDRVVPVPDPLTPTPGKSALSASPGEGSASPDDESGSASSSPETADCATPTVTVTPGADDDVPAEAPTGVPTGVPTGEPTGVPTGEPTDTSTAPSTTPSTNEAAHCPAGTVAATPPTGEPERPLVPSGGTGVPDSGTTAPEVPTFGDPTAEGSGTFRDSPDELGPETVPDTPDVPDGGGLIPDDPAGTDSVFGSPTDLFDS